MFCERKRVGMLPERRRNQERITKESALNWGRRLWAIIQMPIISISFRGIVQPVRRGILQVQVRFPPSAQGGGKGESRVYGGVGK